MAIHLKKDLHTGTALKTKAEKKRLKLHNLAKLLGKAEQDTFSKRTRPIRSFLKEFKDSRGI